MLYFFGDSITAGGYPALVATALSLEHQNMGVGGDFVADQFRGIHLTSGKLGISSVRLSQDDIAVCALGTNDLIWDSQNSQGREMSFASGHLANLLSLAIPPGTRLHAVDMAPRGFAPLSPSICPEGAYTSSVGATLAGRVSGTDIVIVGLANAFLPGHYTIYIDEEPFGPFAAMPPGGVRPSEDLEYGPFARIVTNLSDGEHDVRIVSNAAHSCFFFFVAGLNRAQVSGPTVVCPNLYRFTAAGNASQHISPGRLRRYNRLIANNVAFCQKLGLDVRLANWFGTIDPAAHLGPDGVHPNSSGATALAAAVTASVQAATEAPSAYIQDYLCVLSP